MRAHTILILLGFDFFNANANALRVKNEFALTPYPDDHDDLVNLVSDIVLSSFQSLLPKCVKNIVQPLNLLYLTSN